MDEVQIRWAESADLAVLAKVFRRSSLSVEGDRATLLAHPEVLQFDGRSVAEGRTRVAVDGERVVGFSTTSGTDDAVELEDLFVEPDVQRRGVGRALMDDVVQRLRAEGVPFLAVTANGAAVPFYRSVGFVDDGVAPTAFGSAPRMRLDLGSSSGSPDRDQA